MTAFRKPQTIIPEETSVDNRDETKEPPRIPQMAPVNNSIHQALSTKDDNNNLSKLLKNTISV